MALANDQADIDMITQAQNAGVAALGEDATPQGIAQYAQSFEALVAQMKQKRLRLSGGAMSTATDINGNPQQPGQVYNIGSGTYQDTK